MLYSLKALWRNDGQIEQVDRKGDAEKQQHTGSSMRKRHYAGYGQMDFE